MRSSLAPTSLPALLVVGLLATGCTAATPTDPGTTSASATTSATPTPTPSAEPFDAATATLPAGVCSTGERGWASAYTITLSDGSGESTAADGSYGGASVLSTTLLGSVDLDGDGQVEHVVQLQCSGTPIADCCAGRNSIANTVVALHASGETTSLAAPTLMGGASEPGDSYGPAARGIKTARLDGTSVVTEEYIIYPEQYTATQVGGDPTATVSVTYQFSGGVWTASRP